MLTRRREKIRRRRKIVSSVLLSKAPKIRRKRRKRRERRERDVTEFVAVELLKKKTDEKKSGRKRERERERVEGGKPQ